MIKIGALWKREKDGSVFFSGQIDTPCPIILNPETSVLLFKNKSEHEKSPYFDILIAENRKQNDNQDDEEF